MSNISVLANRFAELERIAEDILSRKTHYKSDYTGDTWQVDQSQALTWIVNVEHLLSLLGGGNSVHARVFTEAKPSKYLEGGHSRFLRLQAIFSAAKSDFDGGLTQSVASLIHAEVFDSELDQARGLLEHGYKVPAAVIAGVVLETSIRTLCTNRSIPHGKLDKMNTDLSKAGLYTLLVQKRVTALADIRNNAAHGHPEKFTEEDVADMIKQVERFLTDFPS